MADLHDRSNKLHPRLMMQFQKQQRIPKLISINQAQQQGYESYQSQNSQTQRQKQYQYVRSRSPKSDNDSRLQLIRLQRQLQIQKSQKVQLKTIIKELTLKSERLKQINQHLIARLKEVQKNYIQNRSELEKQNQQQCRKLKNNLYFDVQYYLKSNIQTLKNSLQGQKMNPKVQQKIQNFMEEMLQINPHNVQMLKISRQRQQPQHLSILSKSYLKIRSQKDSIQKLNNISNKSFEYTQKKSLGPQRNQYQTLLKNLSRQKSKRQLTHSYYQSYNSGIRTNQKERRRNWLQDNSNVISKSLFKNQYSTTPHKRKKIFQKL